uniref:NADH dehydrogenase [ubiquinone] 1 alpha subcomplex subunit 9, mitochondrial n=1 Tax=Plectus sambesii TaxID=2011161 RepID=A0A914VPN9_9BILA
MSLLRVLPAGRSAPLVQVASLHQSSKQCEQASQQHGQGIGGVTLPGPVRSGTSSAYRKGTGGRSSFSGNVITVFGNSGRIGLPVVNRLAKEGAQMIIPYRCDGYWLKEHKVVGDLGQILFFPFHLKDEASIRKVVKYSNIVINLIGTGINTKHFSFHDTNVDGARRLARISREMGVERFIHFSALNATTEPEPVLIPGGSQFLRTKALGEIAVREEFPDATIIRPAQMFGEQDRFIMTYISNSRKIPFYNTVHMYRGGEETYKMPVFNNDVVIGLQKIVQDPSTVGQTYEFVGPHCYQLSELVDYILRKALLVKELHQEAKRRHGYNPYTTMMTNLLEFVGRFRRHTPYFDWEYFETVECTNDVLTGAPTLKDLGMRKLTEFEHVGGEIARVYGYYKWIQDKYGDLKPPPLPIRSPPIIRKRSARVNAQSSFGANVAANVS